MNYDDKYIKYMLAWREDWNRFARECLGVKLDAEQRSVIDSVQYNPRTAVSSGTSRGKDYVSAVACLCFLYLTPRFNKQGELVENTKVIMTAPTGRQVYNIMMPEISRIFKKVRVLPGVLQSSRIKTSYEEWFLTGFKASEETEAWSGLHAAHIMFAVTEASGISETIFDAIEGNLQGDSRLLLVFNPNRVSGYAAKAMSSERFCHFRLNSLNAENVVSKKILYHGQVDYDWVNDKVKTWCTRIGNRSDFNEGDGDFEWEGNFYRPNDLFRVKVLGMFPKAAEDSLIPYEWVTLAQERYKKYTESATECVTQDLNMGIDVAGMGRDNSVLCLRYGDYVSKFITHQSAGKADHMKIVGMVINELNNSGVGNSRVIIDTIGEGAGVYSRLQELNVKGVVSCKFSESANGLSDMTGQYTFVNMRAYLHWCVRNWLDPKINPNAMLPPDDCLMEEATSIRWSFTSNGAIMIEKKDEIKKRLGRSPDKFDALCNTFYPKENSINSLSDDEILDDFE